MTGHREPSRRLSRWVAVRAARPEFVKASQARIWRITTLAIVAIIGATLAVVAYVGKNDAVDRLSGDETCLKSVVGELSQRSSVLTRLSKRRSDADQARQNWNTVEQQIFARALSGHPLPRAVLRREFARANRHYLHADARYRRANTRYNQAAQAHPVPKLNCDGGRLDQPAPTVTATSTTHATTTRAVRIPHNVPGPMRTRVIVRTVTEPPGKHRGRHHGQHGR